MAEDRPSLPVARFSTTGLTPDDSFSAWRDVIASVFDVAPQAEHANENFQADVASVHLGRSFLTLCNAGAQRFVRSRGLIAREDTDHFLVQLYVNGGCEGLYGDRATVVKPGDVSIIDLAQPLATRASKFGNITLVLPRNELASVVAGSDDLHGRIISGRSPLGGVLADHLRSLARHVDRMTPAEAAHIATATAGLVAACVGAEYAPATAMARARTAVLKRRITDYIDRNVRDQAIGPEALGRYFNISRSRLYRMFEDDGGIAAYIQWRRLVRCVQVLSDPSQRHKKIKEVAFDFGFASEAHFSRVFRQAFGLSPSEARSIGDVGTVGSVEIGMPKGGFLNDWIRSLGQ